MPFMALDQHFCNTCHGSQVTIYLERGMNGPKIGKGALSQEFGIYGMCFVCLFRSGPYIHPVGHGPPCGIVAPEIQDSTHCTYPLRFSGIDQRTGIYCAQV